jgi:hypothetical protein
LGEAKENSRLLHVGSAAANVEATMRTEIIAAKLFISFASFLGLASFLLQSTIMVRPGVGKVVKEMQKGCQDYVCRCAPL